MTVLATLLMACAGGLAALVGPSLIARLPEPKEPSPDKVAYRDLAAARWLRLWLGLTGAGLGAAIGAAVGCQASLLPWGFLIPMGVVLSSIDLRVRLLPTALIAPSYVAIAALVGLAAAVEGNTDVLVRAGVGWLSVGGLYLVLWLIAPRGVGYGDVRFSGIIGMALGCIGWPAIVVGAWFGFFLGGVGGLVLRRWTGLRMNAHGPAMLLGAVIGVICGEPIYHALYR